MMFKIRNTRKEWIKGSLPLPRSQLFHIHSNKFKLHPVGNLSQASVLCITHAVFLFGICKYTFNLFVSEFTQLRYSGVWRVSSASSMKSAHTCLVTVFSNFALAVHSCLVGQYRNFPVFLPAFFHLSFLSFIITENNRKSRPWGDFFDRLGGCYCNRFFCISCIRYLVFYNSQKVLKEEICSIV